MHEKVLHAVRTFSAPIREFLIGGLAGFGALHDFPALVSTLAVCAYPIPHPSPRPFPRLLRRS